VLDKEIIKYCEQKRTELRLKREKDRTNPDTSILIVLEEEYGSMRHALFMKNYHEEMSKVFSDNYECAFKKFKRKYPNDTLSRNWILGLVWVLYRRLNQSSRHPG
jgi:hypothetical protein